MPSLALLLKIDAQPWLSTQGVTGMAGNVEGMYAQVTGLVQGVFFRDFVHQHARRLDLAGYVRNLSEGATVEVYAEGEKACLQQLLQLLWQGPPEARVRHVQVQWRAPQGQYQRFQIVG